MNKEKFKTDCVGKIIAEVEWDDVDLYWVFIFTDGTEMCVRLMAEEVSGQSKAR